VLKVFKRVTTNDVLSAIKESLIVLVYALLPTSILAFFVFAQNSLGYMDSFFSVVEIKEFYLLSISFLAPCFWIVNRDRENLPSFPGQLVANLLILIFTVVFVIVVVVLSQQLANSEKLEILRTLGKWWTVLSFVLFFFFSVLNNAFSRKAPDPESEMDKGKLRQDQLKDGLQQRRRSKP